MKSMLLLLVMSAPSYPAANCQALLDQYQRAVEAMEAACAVDSVSPRCIDLTQAAVKAQTAFYDAGCAR